MNVPFSVLIPCQYQFPCILLRSASIVLIHVFIDIIAAYRDSTTDLGAFLHMIRARAADPHWDPLDVSEQFDTPIESESESMPLMPDEEKDHDVWSPGSISTPRFSMFVTEPESDSSTMEHARSQLPMPITQRV